MTENVPGNLRVLVLKSQILTSARSAVDPSGEPESAFLPGRTQHLYVQ